MPEAEPAAVRLRPAATLTHWARPLLLLLLLLALSIAVRYQVVEPARLAHLCEPDPWHGWCALRSALLQLFVSQRIGWFALVCALLALFSRARAIALAGLALAGCALVLYSAEPGAAALVVSVAVLARR